jgi:hypothetical protein
VTPDEPTRASIDAAELERLRRIERAAQDLLVRMEGKRSASQVLTALADLRAAFRESQAPRDP